MKSQRGEVVTILVVILAAAGVGLLAGWKPLSIFKKGPPTAQLADTQAELTKARTLLASNEVKLKAAEAKNEQAKDSQVGYSQQMVTGTALALAKAPISPEVVLARSLNERAALGLKQAIGSLPADKQAEIQAIVEGALSAKQAEVDAAKAALLLKDAQLAKVTEEREAVKAQIPLLAAEVSANQAEVEAKNRAFADKVQEVARYADKAAAEAKANGNLSETITRLAWLIAGLILVYVIAHVWLPSVGQSYPGTIWEKLALTVRNLTSTHD